MLSTHTHTREMIIEIFLFCLFGEPAHRKPRYKGISFYVLSNQNDQLNDYYSMSG